MTTLRKVAQLRIGSPFLAGLVYAFSALVLLTVFISLLLFLTGMKESALPVAAYIIHGIALLFGGFVSGKRAGTKGWYHGGTVGLMYAVIIALVGFLGFDASLSTQTLIPLLLFLLIAALGGIVGVNSSK